MIDEYLALCETEPNFVMFADDYGNDSPTNEGSWERLVICCNKRAPAFPLRDLLAVFEASPNCCRQEK